MSDFERAMYLTDDRDLPDDEQQALVIFPGGNGDWYVQVAPKNGRTLQGVRICTSGGAASNCPGLGVAVAEAYRAMMAAQSGKKLEYVPSRLELEQELLAWREKFPKYQFDGILSIEMKYD
ncbi:hypothetical protein [Ralstonia insidiosa]|nr:hypothetical protein [Ralstonia insidiosa]MBA9939272.1 hypothetical protein [Ralstonia insidiosa]MBC9968046.1 hypothetical protein [Ralstonia insidiosa]MBX3904391.1 hypothetical protein [Ralstonia insidiosa]